MSKYEERELLHCVVSGQGEYVTLVSPYQFRSLKAGQTKYYQRDNQ
jgi:hypothetical protein